MSPVGLYFHFPFCKSRCIYCAFYSQTQYTDFQHYVGCIIHEAKATMSSSDVFTEHTKIDTVYLGGGTPSLIPVKLLSYLFTELYSTFDLSNIEEITIEVNPDDVNEEYIRQIKSFTPINRISIGVQSFNDDELKIMNRRHNADKACKAIEIISQNFDNFSIDLIYGLPLQTSESWEASINKALAFNPKHISAYSLSIENGTPLAKMISEEKITVPDEDFTINCYHRLNEILREHGYLHYEISNYCLPNYHSRHNSNYWKDFPYIGMGAGAHSYDCKSRHWNVKDIKKYMEKIDNCLDAAEHEIITQDMKYNEYIMLGLRTSHGIDYQYINDYFGKGKLNHTIESANKVSRQYIMPDCRNALILNEEGMLFADGIASDFFII